MQDKLASARGGVVKRALLGFVGGAAATVLVVAAQIIAWGLMAEHYDDDPQGLTDG